MKTSKNVLKAMIAAAIISSGFIGLLACPLSNVNAQGVGINPSGNPPSSSAGLDVDFNNKGVLLPRLTTSQRNAITAIARGLIIYNIDCDELDYYNGTAWRSGGILSPIAASATNNISTSFSANWTATCNNVSYFLDVSDNSSFSTFVSGYNNLSVGTATTYSVTGLTCNSTYYYRLRSSNSCVSSSNSGTSTGTTTACSGVWTQRAAFIGSGRQSSVGFSIGTKGYIGTGNDGAYKKDFWEWDQPTNTWTQKADFAGAARWAAVGFSIGTKGYIGTGANSLGKLNDFYEWDQAGNFWTAKANFGGTARFFAAGFSIGNKGYIGTGNDGVYKNDFFEWDQASNTWASKNPFTGSARGYCAAFSIGTKGYIGIGYDGISKKDFYEWDQASNTWTKKADLAGPVRDTGVGFSIGTKGYIGTGSGASFYQDFYEYNPATDTWTAKANFPGGNRAYDAGFSIGTKGYICTGIDASSNFYQDFYEFQQ